MLGRPLAPLAPLALALALTASCAPPPHAPPAERETVMQRYLAARTLRERRASGLAADALLWARVPGQPLPGAEARLLVAGPDRLRVTVGSAFGVAADLAVRGDTLEAWVPSRRLALELDALAPGASVDAGTAAVRTLAASWQPPGGAWDAAVVADSGWCVRWRERADSLLLWLDASGRPTTFEWRPAAGDTLRVRYTSWAIVDGVPWPDRTEWSETGREVSARVRLSRVRAIPEPARARLVVTRPPGARRVTTADLSGWWHELMGETP